MTDHLIQRPAAMTYYQKAQLRTSYKYLARRRIKAIRPALLPYCCASWFLRNCIIAVHDSLGLEKDKIYIDSQIEFGKKRLIRQKERCCLFSYLNCTNKKYYSSSTASQFFMDLCTQLTCSPFFFWLYVRYRHKDKVTKQLTLVKEHHFKYYLKHIVPILVKYPLSAFADWL